MAQTTHAETRKPKSPVRELIETLVFALLIALVVRTFVVEVYRVDGTSMENTLHSEERVLVNKFIYRLRPPKPGEVVVFRYPLQPDRHFIKRVIAVEGQTVELKGGKVYVDGEPFPEVDTIRATGADFGPFTVPEDSIFVLGDNRTNSEDSRVFGEVPLANVRGEAVALVWPLSRMGALENPVEAAE